VRFRFRLLLRLRLPLGLRLRPRLRQSKRNDTPVMNIASVFFTPTPGSLL
jgi:hypothetical protein